MILFTIICINTFVYAIMMQPVVVDNIHFTTFVFQYVTYLVQLVLSVIPEPRARSKSKELTENQVQPG